MNGDVGDANHGEQAELHFQITAFLCTSFDNQTKKTNFEDLDNFL